MSIAARGRTIVPVVRPVSPQDLRVLLVPDTSLSAAALAAERASLTRIVQDLPGGATAHVLSPAPTTVAPSTATPTAATVSATGNDRAQIVQALTALTSTALGATPAERLETALAAFPGEPAVGRALVLVTGDGRAESPAILDDLRQRLLASRVQLFVIDLTTGRRADVTTLAEATGGFAASPGPNGDGMAPDVAQQVVRALEHQFRIRFLDEQALPHPVTVRLSSGTRVWQREVHLPVSNPAVPALRPRNQPTATGSPSTSNRPVASLRSPTTLTRSEWPPDLLLLVPAGLFAVGFAAVALLARRREPGPGPSRAVTGMPVILPDLSFVVVLPCRNAEKVVRAAVNRLLSLSEDNLSVLVVDDGSDDATSAVVTSMMNDRVWLLRRQTSSRRWDEEDVLNAAMHEIYLGGHLGDLDPGSVVVVVTDVGEELDPQVLTEAAALLADPAVARVQTGVRFTDRNVSLLTRMEDIEHVVHAQVLSRCRGPFGGPGLGGSEFVRASLFLGNGLGTKPWTPHRADGLDLGTRILRHGRRSKICPTAVVHRPGLLDLRQVIDQRSRWFGGRLRAWRLVPTILRGKDTRLADDMIRQVSVPFLPVVASLLSASFVVSVMAAVADILHGRGPLTWWLAATYVAAVGPSVAVLWRYWRQERAKGLTLPTACGYAHVYAVYSLLWGVAACHAVWRLLRRDTAPRADAARAGRANRTDEADTRGTEPPIGGVGLLEGIMGPPGPDATDGPRALAVSAAIATPVPWTRER